MKRTILSLMLLVASLASFAYDFVVDGIYYNVLSKDDLTCEVTSGDNKYTGEVTIPSQVSYAGKVFNVTSIGKSAFYECSGLTSVTIPNSVISIGDYTFIGCSGLTSVTIPNSVTSIGNRAFEFCSRLTSVNISNVEAWCKIEFHGSDANPLNYARNLYLNGELVTDLAIPNSVTSIEKGAFKGCSGLTSVTIPNSVTSIGNYAFSHCI